MSQTNSQSMASRVGMSLGSSRFDEELRSYLQRRLRILTTTVAILLCLLSGSFVVSLAADPSRSLGRALVIFCTTFPNDALFFMTAASSILALLLWFRRAGPTLLNLTDALFLQVLILPCLLLYARLHHFLFPGFAVVVPFLMLFILARAILIPSKAWWTVLLSLPAALGVFVIQLRAGNSFISPDQAFGQDHFVNMVLQNQVLLLGSIAIAATASRVNLGLRRQSFNARHVGQYKIEKLLGTGGMGEVYVATHSLLKRPTAIKFLRPDIAGDQTLVRFEQEVKHSSRLSHPNNISIFDYGHTAEGIFYYAMELLRGANLRRIVASTGVMPPGRVIHVLAQACGALWEAHSLDIIHRDIKPENMMLCEQGCEYDVVKVLDFGLVMDLADPGGAEEEGGGISGTPETMSPESLSPGSVGPASDLYSLCAVGCFLLTGQAIFEATSVGDFLKAHREIPPIPPSRIRPEVPRDLEEILLRGLEKDPSRRPRSAKIMRQMLLDCRNAGDWDGDQAAEWWRTHSGLLEEKQTFSERAATQTLMKATSVTMTLSDHT